MLRALGFFRHVIPADAPHQNGRCERHGGLVEGELRAGWWRAGTASFTEADTLLFSWCSGRVLDCRVSKDTVDLQTLDEDPRLQGVVSREQAQRRDVRMSTRTLALETYA